MKVDNWRLKSRQIYVLCDNNSVKVKQNHSLNARALKQGGVQKSGTKESSAPLATKKSLAPVPLIVNTKGFVASRLRQVRAGVRAALKSVTPTRESLKQGVAAVMIGITLMSSMGCTHTGANTEMQKATSPVAMRMIQLSENHAPAKVEAAEVAQEQSFVKTDADVKKLVDELLENDFPELAGKDVSYEFFESDSYFFRSRPGVGSVLNPFSKTKYIIDINRAIYDKDLPTSAAKAILAHELGHTLCYVDHGVGGMLGTLAGELSQSHQEHVERETDLVAMERGFGEGLTQYREWIYEQLDEAGLAEKQATYFTPAEIKAIDEAALDTPEIYQALAKDPPKNLEQTLEAIAKVQAEGVSDVSHGHGHKH